MQQNGRDRVQRGAVRDVRTPVAEHANDSVSHGATLSRQVVWQAVSRVHKWRQHDGLVWQFCGAKDLEIGREREELLNFLSNLSVTDNPSTCDAYLVHHVPIVAIEYVAAILVLATQCLP